MSDAKSLRLNLGFPASVTNNAALSTFILDATTDKIEWIIQAKEAATITKLGFTYGVRAGTPPTYRISFQGVDVGVGNGFSDGTVKGGGTPASQTFTPPADTSWDGTWQWITLANAYTCTRGELLSIVIDYSSGTIAAGNSSTFATDISQLNQRVTIPYVIQNNAGVRTKIENSPVYGYASAGQVYGFPLKSTTQTQYSSDSTPDEYAAKFNFPATWWNSNTIRGVRWFGRTAASGKTIKVQLYTGTTVLQTITLPSDLNTQVSSLHRSFEIFFTEATLSILSAGGDFRIGFQAQNTVSNWAVLTMDFNSSSEELALDGMELCTLSTRTDAGAWTDDATRRVPLEIIFGDITAPSGAFALGNMRGGMCN